MKIRLFSLIINIKKLEEFKYIDVLKRNLDIDEDDFDLLMDSLDALFLKSLELMADVDIDEILRYNHIEKSLKYLSNKYVKEKSDELIATLFDREKINELVNENTNKIKSQNLKNPRNIKDANTKNFNILELV